MFFGSGLDILAFCALHLPFVVFHPHSLPPSSCVKNWLSLSNISLFFTTKYPLRIFTLRRKSALADTGITHIVSVLKYDFKDFEDWEKYEHLNIQVDDVEDENLLGEFERSGSFIENALRVGKDGKRGSVLVHW